MTSVAPALHAGGGLYLDVDRPSVVHRLPAHVKVIGALVLVGAGVGVPTSTLIGPGSAHRWAALIGVLALAALVVGLARLPLRQVRRRMIVEVPFVVFALLLPFVAAGERVEVLGVPLAEAGLVGAGALLLKATTGVLVGITLAATTTPHELLAGLRRLRLPAVLIAITSFMLRYAAVVFSDLQRMRRAREARGYTGGGRGHLRHEAAGVGSLFIRSYERGERVHQAMLARGYTGVLPAPEPVPTSARDWLVGLSLPLIAVLLCLLTWF